jgi:predicted metal-dependent HD superfamily phosphohydrolase
MLDKNRFQTLCLNLEIDNFADIFDLLYLAYNQGHRAYHNSDHIVHCLREFDRVKYLADRQDEIEMALWFHDAIYDPHSSHNEEESALWAKSIFGQRNSSREIAAYVARLILATRHPCQPLTTDEKILVDIDLSILGTAPDIFDRYDRQIRTEYSWVDAFVYREGRTRVLQEFLDRETIFQTSEFQQRSEQTARTNLHRAIARLQNLDVTNI